MDLLTVNNNHKYIYNTYKELNKIMPHNYLKLKVLPSQKYCFSNQNLIGLIETNYNENKTNYKNEKPKKKIYLFSSQNTDNDISEKNIAKDLFNTKFIHKSKIKKNKTRNKTEINKYFTSKTIKTLRSLSLRKNGIFNPNPINNYFLRNNICLPEITKRMKFKIPRNERETNGFKVIGNEYQNYNNKILKTNKIDNYKTESEISSNNKKNYYSCEKIEKTNNLEEKKSPYKIISIIHKNKNTKCNLINGKKEYQTIDHF